MKPSAKEILQFIWLLPATILVWLFYVLPLWAMREIKLEGRARPFVWVFENPISSSRYDKMWKKWAGWAGPCVYIYKDLKDKRKNLITREHELVHNDQYMRWGIFHTPMYLLFSGWILLSNLWKKQEDRKHAHLDNPFEIDARRGAGQRIEIPQEEWPDGPKDYNPWF